MLTPDLEQNPIPEEIPSPHPVGSLDVKLSDSELYDLGFKLCRNIQAGIQQQGQLPDRWEQLEKDYSNQPSAGGVQLVPGQEPRHLNITQPRIDQLVAAIVGPLTQQEPFFIAKGLGGDQEKVKMVEDTVQFLLRMARFERHLRMGTRGACLAEPFIFRVMLDTVEPGTIPGVTVEDEIDGPKRKCFPRIDVIHPKGFPLYPAAVGGIQRATVAPHVFFQTKAEIKEMMLSGAYFSDDNIGSDQIKGQGENPQDLDIGRRKDWSLTEETDGADPDDQLIRCYDATFKGKFGKDTERQWYRAIVAFRQNHVLKIEKYPYSRPWYFGHYLHEEYEAFYSANPVAQNLVQIQSAFNDIYNLMHDGSVFNAFPAAVTTAYLPDGFMNYGAGTLTQVSGSLGPSNFVQIKSGFDPSEMPALLELLQRLADAAVRVSQAGMGQEFNKGMTATEASGILQGQQAGLDEYRDVASLSGVEICDFMRELAYRHHADLVETFGDAYPCKDPSVLQEPLLWEANGKTSENLPQTIINKIQLLFNMLAPFIPVLSQLGINVPEIFRVCIDALKLPVDTSKIISDMAQGAPVPPGQDPNAPPGAPALMPPQGPGLAQQPPQQNDPNNPAPTGPDPAILRNLLMEIISAHLGGQGAGVPPPMGLPGPQ